jgi:hypothetical protein
MKEKKLKKYAYEKSSKGICYLHGEFEIEKSTIVFSSFSYDNIVWMINRLLHKY